MNKIYCIDILDRCNNFELVDVITGNTPEACNIEALESYDVDLYHWTNPYEVYQENQEED